MPKKRVPRKKIKEFPLYVHTGIHQEPLLPLGIVHYPGVYGFLIGFSETEISQPYLCSCQSEALKYYFLMQLDFENAGLKDLREILLKDAHIGITMFPKFMHDLGESQEPVEFGNLKFLEGICHRCNKISPEAAWCHEMYGGIFKQRHGWYINLKKFELNQPNPDMLELYLDLKKAEKDLMDFRRRNPYKVSPELESIKNKAARRHDNYLENLVRQEFNHKPIGSGWVNETLLYNIVVNILPNHQITRHIRPDWLEGLELDIYIPKLGIGIEYQGIQHFQAVDHWGGQKSLENLQIRDKKKQELCKKAGVVLVEFDYTEPLTTELVRGRLAETGILTDF